jgi:hypothetical protein
MADFLYFVKYFAAGFFLKQGDDLLDEMDNEGLAWVTLAVAGTIFGLIMTVSEWDLVLLSSIIIGVLASGKVNRTPYIGGFIMIFVMILFWGVPTITSILDFATILIVLFLAAVLDEKGNDWADRSASPRAAVFFEYRFTMKVVVLMLCIPWPLFLPTAIGMWIFDGGYELAGWTFRQRAKSQSP